MVRKRDSYIQREAGKYHKVPDSVDVELLAKAVSNTEMATLLTSLAKTIK